MVSIATVEQCDGCDRQTERGTCKAYTNPSYWWDRGNCPLATHLVVDPGKQNKVRVGQQKRRKDVR